MCKKRNPKPKVTRHNFTKKFDVIWQYAPIITRYTPLKRLATLDDQMVAHKITIGSEMHPKYMYLP